MKHSHIDGHILKHHSDIHTLKVHWYCGCVDAVVLLRWYH